MWRSKKYTKSFNMLCRLIGLMIKVYRAINQLFHFPIFHFHNTSEMYYYCIISNMKWLLYHAPPSRPEGPRHCPDRGNAGVALVFSGNFWTIQSVPTVNYVTTSTIVGFNLKVTKSNTFLMLSWLLLLQYNCAILSSPFPASSDFSFSRF